MEKTNCYRGQIRPDENIIFVFGSNTQGRHGAGAAKYARNYFGAVYGQAEGLQGHSYAIVTKDLTAKDYGRRSIPPEQITEGIRKMYACAAANPGLLFCVAYRNAPDSFTLNGYSGREMMLMFRKAGEAPSNVLFSEEWAETGILSDPSKGNTMSKEEVKYRYEMNDEGGQITFDDCAECAIAWGLTKTRTPCG